MNIDTWPPEGSSPVFIRGYHSRKYEELIEEFHRDAVLLLQQGYLPAGQHYIQGEWGIGWVLFAVLTITFLVGILLCFRLLLSRPIGTLTVTYVRRVGA